MLSHFARGCGPRVAPRPNPNPAGGCMPVVGRLVLGAFVGAAALAPAALLAQSVSSRVAGTVVDQTRQVIRGATVTLVNELTGDARATQTNDTGAFVFPAVQPSRYTIRVELTGFTPFERKNTTVPPNEQLSAGTILLEVGGLAEAVTATAQGRIVQAMSSEHSAVLR